MLLADFAAARRVSIWRVLDKQRQLNCEDAFERGSGGHVGGLQVTRTELPQFFALLDAAKDLAVCSSTSTIE
jgi:hypothetical protein